jgi:hypothetical protein
MGTWGTGAFDNDGAADWALAFEDGATAGQVNKPIQRLAKRASGEAIDLDDALEAVAAAEVMAAARGNEGRGVPPSVRTWITRTGYSPDPSLVVAAARVVDTIAAAGELHDEWASDPQWPEAMSDLARRLRAPAKAASPTSPPRTPKGKSSPAAAPDLAGPSPKQIRKKLGYRVAANALDAEHNPTWLNAATRLTDADLALIGQLTSLKKLVLAEGRFSPAGLQRLVNLELVWLNLEATNVTDDAGPIVARIKTLVRLDVHETRVSDRFLECLVGLSGLRLLNVIRTKVTDRGIAWLQAAMPECRIHSDEDHPPPAVWWD